MVNYNHHNTNVPTNVNDKVFRIMKIMPLFGSKFSPKKAPQRKVNNDSPKDLPELVSEQRTCGITLGEQQFVFDKGDWIPQNGQTSSAYKSKQKLKKKIQELEEENNLLRLKYEMMLNMLTQAAAEGQLNQTQLDKLRKKKK